MKIIKRNQLVILVISLMLITAGYLNFTADSNTTKTAQLYAELGDATLANANAIVENATEETDENNLEEAASENLTNDIQEESIETAITVDEDSYFTTSKLERENMYSQILETYQQIYNNAQSNSEQKTGALEEIAKINKIKNAIMIAENLVSAKGFTNVVIFVNENSVSVIIGKDELQSEEIAQIQNIISRELNVDVGIIHISTK